MINFDHLERDALIDLCEKAQYRYLAAVTELNRYRDLLDKVKSEDLCDTVQQRETVLRNNTQVVRDQLTCANNEIERMRDQLNRVANLARGYEEE